MQSYSFQEKNNHKLYSKQNLPTQQEYYLFNPFMPGDLNIVHMINVGMMWLILELSHDGIDVWKRLDYMG